MESPFASTERLRRPFVAGLQTLLQQESLGTFILVCANATYDPAIYRQLAAPLRAQFERLLRRFRHALGEGLALDEVEEDLLVFLKIATVGFEALQPTATRRVGPWQLQFNHLRSFRPKRISGQKPEGISAPFNPQGFHFNKPFMQRELFWSGELAGRQADLYYNKYPFADLHGLLVPERDQCLPQYLQRHYHDYAWEVTALLGRTLPGAGIGYNSYGAFASVNHLHLQLFVQPQALAVEDSRWRHNGGAQSYPAPCLTFDQAAEMWQAIAQLHRDAVPYSLLYRAGRGYLFPRRPQGERAPPPWSSGFTWSELAGAILTFNGEAYGALEATTVEEFLREAGRAA